MSDYPLPVEQVISLGYTGPGLRRWRRATRAMAYRPRRFGRFGLADAKVARAVQREAGITVDGVVGPQTWWATFDILHGLAVRLFMDRY